MMTKWYVKDLSRLTDVSVQTLHHYDRTGLLCPSLRQSNGYRLYSETDLLRLQQIIALKFFGFTLTQIKKLLSGEVNASDQLGMQAHLLEEESQTLLEASQTLKRIVNECGQTKSIPWETIIQLIKVYRMTDQLKKTWAGKVLSPEELKDYVNFENDLKIRFTDKQKDEFHKSWAGLVDHIKANLHQDPESAFGIKMGKELMELVTSLYGKKYSNLRRSIWEKGFKEGKMEGDLLLAPELVSWMDRAISAYYKDRIYTLLDQVNSSSHPALEKEWHDCMDEMFGSDSHSKQEALQMELTDERVSKVAKAWLKKIMSR